MKRDLNWLKAKADIRIGCFDMVSMGYAIEMYNEDQVHIEKLEKEIASLKEQLKREQDCVDFYADKDNWVDMEMIGYSSSIRNDEQCGNEFGESEYLSIGGKLARSAQARREK